MYTMPAAPPPPPAPPSLYSFMAGTDYGAGSGPYPGVTSMSVVPPPASRGAGTGSGLSSPGLSSVGQREEDECSTDSPAKKQSKWSPEEDNILIELRGRGMKWEDISRRVPGRSVTSCRLHYQNYLERRSEWDEERKNKLARLYERFKPEMWAKVAEEMHIPWRAVEAMHWHLGETDMATRAGVVPFVLATVNSSQQQQQQQQQPHPAEAASHLHHHHHRPTRPGPQPSSRGHVHSQSQGSVPRADPHLIRYPRVVTAPSNHHLPPQHHQIVPHLAPAPGSHPPPHPHPQSHQYSHSHPHQPPPPPPPPLPLSAAAQTPAHPPSLPQSIPPSPISALSPQGPSNRASLSSSHPLLRDGLPATRPQPPSATATAAGSTPAPEYNSYDPSNGPAPLTPGPGLPPIQSSGARERNAESCGRMQLPSVAELTTGVSPYSTPAYSLSGGGGGGTISPGSGPGLNLGGVSAAASPRNPTALFVPGPPLTSSSGSSFNLGFITAEATLSGSTKRGRTSPDSDREATRRRH